MNIYLLMSDRPFHLDISAQFPEHHLVWDHAVLIESEQSQSRVYHAIKHALPADTPLMIAILDHQPKFKGAKPGLLKWIRERYDAMPARF
ncbi:MAG: hypothetical protein ACX94C_14455 [Phycisphaerales bacterium]